MRLLNTAISQGLAAGLCLLLSAGCNRPLQPSRHSVPDGAIRRYTEAELNELLVPGMALSEVTNTLGLPGAKMQMDENTYLITYLFPVREILEETKEQMLGFDMYFRDDKLIRWVPIMVGAPEIISAGGAVTPYNRQSIRLYLENDDLAHLVTTVDTTGSADIHDLNVPPALSVRATVLVESAGSGGPDELTLTLILSKKDAEGLKKLSAANLGKRLLVVWENRIIAAPQIMEPLATEKVMFRVKRAALSGLVGRP